MTWRALGDLYQGLLAVNNLTGAKFAYAVARNLSLLKEDVEVLKKAISMSKEYAEYELKRVELAEKSAVIENGKPKIVNDEYEIKDEESFKVELDKLQETHKQAIDDRKKQLIELEKLLKEEMEVDVHIISQDIVPEAINTKQMAGILPIIKE